MRRLIGAAFALLCAWSAFGASKPIATVQLPCESRYQELSPSGTQVAVHCKDRSLHVVDVPEGKEQRVFAAEQRANSFVYSPDGSWFAVGFEDGTVEVDPSRGAAPSKRWKAGSRRIDTLYFLPDAKAIVVGPVDHPAQVWELPDTPKLRATLPFDFGGLIACVASPDGKLLVAAGDDTVIRWYDTATWHKSREYRGFLLETFALTFTPDGKHLLAGGADSRITVLDAATAKEVRQLPAEPGSYIVGIDVLGSTQRAATVYLDGAGEKPPHQLIWDLATVKSVTLKSDSPLTCGGVVGNKLWVGSADGKTLTLSQYD
jgi:WD40 repeat protein